MKRIIDNLVITMTMVLSVIGLYVISHANVIIDNLPVQAPIEKCSDSAFRTENLQYNIMSSIVIEDLRYVESENK